METLKVAQQVALSQYSTMRLGGPAAYAVAVHSHSELVAAYQWAVEQSLPYLIIGGGSNIVWQDSGFKGLVIINTIMGLDFANQPDGSVLVAVGAGENWDAVVAHCVTAGLTGIEALSLIPGTAGATPVQNVGAYGQEIANVLNSVEAYDTQTRQFIMLAPQDCAFGYRSSRFKLADRGRFLITGIQLRLRRGNPQPPFYAGLQRYLDEHNISQYTPATIRQAVIAIRNSKLPDPRQVANNGSFFANPIVDSSVAKQLLSTYPNMPHWSTGDKVKLSAAWLLDQAGFKDYHDPITGMATWHAQALVVVNEQASSTTNLLTFKQRLIDAVQQKFGITLEQEPELLP